MTTPESILASLVHFQRGGDCYNADQAAWDALGARDDARDKADALESLAGRPVVAWLVRRIRRRAPEVCIDRRDITVTGFTGFGRTDPRHYACALVSLTIDSHGCTVKASWLSNGNQDLGEWADRMTDAWRLAVGPR